MNIKPEQVDGLLNKLSTDIRAVLIYGTNEGMVSTFLKQFVKAVCADPNDAFRVVYFDMSTIAADINNLYAEFSAQSLMGGRRVIVIRDVAENFSKEIKELFETSSSDTLLVMTSLTLKTKSALATLAKDDNRLYGIGCYDDRDGDINTLVSKFIAKNSLKIDNSVFQILCSKLSNDRKISNNELDKLIIFLGKRKEILLEDINLAISDTAVFSYEDLCYHIALGQTQKAISSFNKLIFEGESPTTLIRRISYHFMKLLEYAFMSENNESPDKIIAGIRPFVMFYRKNDLMNQIRIWNRSRILNALDVLYEAEKSCKTTNLPDESIASYAILRISNGASKFR